MTRNLTLKPAITEALGPLQKSSSEPVSKNLPFQALLPHQIVAVAVKAAAGPKRAQAHEKQDRTAVGSAKLDSAKLRYFPNGTG